MARTRLLTSARVLIASGSRRASPLPATAQGAARPPRATTYMRAQRNMQRPIYTVSSAYQLLTTPYLLRIYQTKLHIVPKIKTINVGTSSRMWAWSNLGGLVWLLGLVFFPDFVRDAKLHLFLLYPFQILIDFFLEHSLSCFLFQKFPVETTINIFLLSNWIFQKNKIVVTAYFVSVLVN